MAETVKEKIKVAKDTATSKVQDLSKKAKETAQSAKVSGEKPKEKHHPDTH